MFFNNILDGQTFGKDFIKGRYLENTVALDTWLTLGQTARQGTKYFYGILKDQDTDGSFVGGVNNDGGSALVPVLTPLCSVHWFRKVPLKVRIFY